MKTPYGTDDWTATEAERRVFPDGWHTPVRLHSAHYLFCIETGAGLWHTGGRRTRVSAGELLVAPAGGPYRIVLDPGTSLLMLRYRQRLFALEVPADRDAWDVLMGAVRRARRGHPLLAVGALAAPILCEWRLMVDECARKGAGGPVLLKASALRILGLVARSGAVAAEAGVGAPRGPAYSQMLAALRYMEQHATERLYIADIARAAGLSRSHFHALFKYHMGMTAVDYLTRLRIGDACQQLAGTDKPVTAVALDCGFESLSRFYAAFSRHVGIPPARFRAGV